MKQISASLAILAALAAAFSIATPRAFAQDAPSPAVQTALDAISPDELLQHIKTLSSDKFEGRAPGSPGEALTVDYITAQYKKLGLKPGNPDGTYLQNVPLIGFTDISTASYSVNGKPTDLKYQVDYMADTHRMAPKVKLDNTDVVFVGYGVVAPEYGWDDYKGLDVKGKTIVMLVGDPPVPDPTDPAKLDDKMFKGKAMTYYGRWTYKYEIASEKGAAAAIVVHETESAGYPWWVISSSWAQEQFDVKSPDGNAGKVGVEAWMTLAATQKMFAAGGQDYDALKKAAVSKDFHPVPLGVKASFDVKNTVREVQSHNVVAKIEGSDPQLKDEVVIYSAHWDHLGKNEKLKGDQIYNGALDNASGTAALLEEAKAYAALKPAPKRSILFLATTAEEKGLLGAKFYVENPLYPLNKTVADINFDGMNPWGETKDLVVVGLGNTTLEDTMTDFAHAKARTIMPDPEPEKGGFYRNDEFEFAKHGIPAIHTASGSDFPGKPAGWGAQKRKDFTAHDYHQVSDEVKPDWDLKGAAADARLLFQVGYHVAQDAAFPEWKPGTEFKAKRDAMMNDARH